MNIFEHWDPIPLVILVAVVLWFDAGACEPTTTSMPAYPDITVYKPAPPRTKLVPPHPVEGMSHAEWLARVAKQR